MSRECDRKSLGGKLMMGLFNMIPPLGSTIEVCIHKDIKESKVGSNHLVKNAAIGSWVGLLAGATTVATVAATGGISFYGYFLILWGESVLGRGSAAAIAQYQMNQELKQYKKIIRNVKTLNCGSSALYSLAYGILGNSVRDLEECYRECRADSLSQAATFQESAENNFPLEVKSNATTPEQTSSTPHSATSTPTPATHPTAIGVAAPQRLTI